MKSMPWTQNFLATRFPGSDGGRKTVTALDWLCFLLLLMATICSLSTDFLGPKSLDAFIVIASFLFIAFGASLRNTLIVKLFGIALLIQLASWGYSHIYHPEFAESSPKLNRMAPWFLMIPVAFVLRGNTRLSYLLIAAVIIGAVAAPWLSGNGWQEIKRGINGKRISFNLNNAQHTALLFSTCFIAIITLGFLSARKSTQKYMFAAIPLLFICSLGFAFIIVLLQTRASWLGIFVSVATFIFCTATLYKPKKGIAKLRTPLILLLSLLLLVSTFLIMFGEKYDKRLARFMEGGAVNAVIEGQLKSYLQEESTYSKNRSAAVRLAYWYEAGERLQEKPLVGWGGKGRRLAADNANLIPARYRKGLHHLHNSFLDTAVNYGYAGLALIIFLQTYVVYMAHRAWKAHQMPTGLLLFTYCFMTYWLTVNLFESYFYYSSGTLIFGIVSGVILSHYWRTEITHTEPETNRNISPP